MHLRHNTYDDIKFVFSQQCFGIVGVARILFSFRVAEHFNRLVHPF